MSVSTDPHRDMDDRFLDAITRVTANAPQDIHATIDRIIEAYGLKHASYISLNLPNRGRNDPFIIATYDESWIGHYRSRNYHRYDPVIKRGFASILPLNWNEFDLSPTRARQLFGEAREHGVGRNGITFPIRGRHGEQALFSITSDEDDAEWNRSRTAFARDFQLIAYHIHRLVLKTEGIYPDEIKLTPREIDCLRLVACGNSHARTAELTGIKPTTVRYYLETARAKLEAANTIHAVAKAIGLNLISI